MGGLRALFYLDPTGAPRPNDGAESVRRSTVILIELPHLARIHHRDEHAGSEEPQEVQRSPLVIAEALTTKKSYRYGSPVVERRRNLWVRQGGANIAIAPAATFAPFQYRVRRFTGGSRTMVAAITKYRHPKSRP